MRPQIQLAGRIVALLALTTAVPQAAAEAPKRGGTLTYMIAADAPPSFDAHRELTFATVYSGAPFYSVLIRVNPENPGSTTDFVCDLCTEMPQPIDDGRTYTFKIRDGVKFHDGSPLTANDVVASWNKLIFPPEGVTSARQSHYLMVEKVEVVDPTTVVFRLKFATAAFLPALADPRARPPLVREERSGLGAIQVFGVRDRAVDRGGPQHRLLSSGVALSRRFCRRLRTKAGGPGRCDAQRPRGNRFPQPATGGPRRAGRRAG